MQPRWKESPLVPPIPSASQGELAAYIEAYQEREFDRVHFARETIRRGMLAYSVHLAEWLGKPPEERRTTFKPVYEEVLRCLSRALFDATEPWLETQHSEFDLYFWPGLESQFLRETNSRFTFIWGNSPDGEIPCGIGHHSQDGEVVSYRETDTALWFSRALGAHRNDPLDGPNWFEPGGTHGWVTHGDVAVRDSAEEYESKLNWLLVHAEDPDTYAFDVRRGVIGIGLKRGDCRNWGPTVSRFLNDSKEVRSEGRWPWLSPTITGRESALWSPLQEVREALYSIWLAATCQPDWLETQRAWIDEFAESLRSPTPTRPFALPRLAERLSCLSHSRPYGHAYSYWYTLALTGIVNAAKPDEAQSLGSLMIFSSHELHPAYLHVASRAVDRCYTLLRLYEEAVLREYRTGLREQLRRFAHRNLETIEAVRCHLADPKVAPHIDPATHGLLTTLTATVAIHRQVKHRFNTQFKGAPPDPLAFYLSLAAIVGWHRALRAEQETPCYVDAQQLSESADPAASMLAFVGLDLRVDPALRQRFTIKTESFGVVFIHCLSQALYHAFDYKTRNPRLAGDIVTVSFREEGVRLHVTVDNRGDRPHITGQRSKDADELKELGDFYFVSVEGPSWMEDDDCWRTSMTITLV